MADACAGPAAYRPRRARDSPLYRLAETHHETFKQVYDERFASRYGAWRGVVERTLWAFLDCGIEEHGFARVRCDACRREFRVALSCKRRGFCPSCHSKRAVLWAEWLRSEVLAAAPHRQWVFTVPKRLRLFFLYDRQLLGALSRCAWRTVRDLYRAGLADRRAVPGMVVSIQTYGDLANWQPHLHALVSAGVFDRQAEFTPLALPASGVAEELFRRRVIRMLVRQGRLEEDAAAGLLSWRHSGFSVHHAIQVEPDDRAGVERLSRYLVHPPIALGRLTYDGGRARYRGRRVQAMHGAQSVTLDPLEMLARLCQHIPPPGFHLTRLYGAYANRTRGARARQGAAAGERPPRGDGAAEIPTPSQRARRREWAKLIAKVFEVDPLRCHCGGTMRVMAFILDPTAIRKILQHRPRPEARAHAPPPG
ncbi:MAG: transposase [Alphaproteobacteria bacterium]